MSVHWSTSSNMPDILPDMGYSRPSWLACLYRAGKVRRRFHNPKASRSVNRLAVFEYNVSDVRKYLKTHPKARRTTTAPTVYPNASTPTPLDMTVAEAIKMTTPIAL